MGSAVTWNLPNALTVARLACVPVLAWLLTRDASWARDTAAIVFVAAAVTDFFDGAIWKVWFLIWFRRISEKPRCLSGHVSGLCIFLIGVGLGMLIIGMTVAKVA